MSNIDELIEVLLKEEKRYENVEIPDSLEEKKKLYRALRNVRSPKPISKEYLEKQDQYLQEELKEKGIIKEEDISKTEGILSIWRGDITTLEIDAIVNAGNTYLLGCFNPTHRCIDNEIHSAAGIELREECNEIMQGKKLPNGEVVVTSAYNLPSRYVIHTVGPQVGGRVTDQARKDLRNCYWNSLELCKKRNMKTIAFPCIATGLYGFPKEEASKIAIQTVKEFIKENEDTLDHVVFNTFLEEDYEIYQKNIKEEQK